MSDSVTYRQYMYHTREKSNVLPIAELLLVGRELNLSKSIASFQAHAVLGCRSSKMAWAWE